MSTDVLYPTELLNPSRYWNIGNAYDAQPNDKDEYYVRQIKAFDVSLGNNLEVSGNTIFKNDVDIGGKVTITGNKEFEIYSPSTVLISDAGLIDLSADNFRLTTDTDASFTTNNFHIDAATETTISSGIITITGSTIFKSDVSINSTLSVGQDASFQSDVFVDKVLTISGHALFKSDVSINNTLSVGQDASFQSDVFVDKVLTISGDAIFKSDVSINNTLSVGKDASFQSDVFVDKVLTISGDAIFKSDVSINSTLSVGKDASFKSDVFVDKVLTISGHALFKSDVSINDTLSVGQDASFQSDVFVDKVLTISGDAIFKSDVSINSTLYVGQDASFQSDVFVDKVLTISGDAIFKSDVSINNTLSVGKDASFQSDVFVDKVLTISGDAIFKSDVSINSTLYVGQDASFQSDVFVDKVLTISGDAIFKSDVSINNTLSVGQDASFQSDVFVDKVLTISGDAIFKSDVSINNTLSVGKDASFQSDVFVDKVLTISGDAIFKSDVSINSTLSVGKDASFQSDVFVDKVLTISGNAFFKSDVSINDTLYVGQDATFMSDVFMKQKLTVNDDASFQENVYIKNQLNVDNSAIFQSDVIITSGRLYGPNEFYIDPESPYNGFYTDWSGASIQVDNTGIVLQPSISSISTNPFLFEMWFKVNDVTIIDNTFLETQDTSWSFDNEGKINYNNSINNIYESTSISYINNETWHHFAWSRRLKIDGEIETMGFIDGSCILINKLTGSTQETVADFKIKNCKVSEARVSIGDPRDVYNITITSSTIPEPFPTPVQPLSKPQVGMLLAVNNGDDILFGISNQFIISNLPKDNDNPLTDFKDNIHLGTVIINGNLNVKGKDVNIDHNLKIDGTTTINNGLHVTGKQGYSDRNFVVSNTDASINQNLYLGGTLYAPPVFYIDPTFHEDGRNATGDISGRTGTVVIRGNLEVEGTKTIVNSSEVDISDLAIRLASNAETVSQLHDAGIDISNEYSLKIHDDGDSRYWYFAGADLQIKENLHVLKSAKIDGDLSINRNLEVSNNLIVNGTFNLNSSFTVEGKTTINNDIVVSQDANIDGNLTVSGDIVFNGLTGWGDQDYDKYVLGYDHANKKLKLMHNNFDFDVSINKDVNNLQGMDIIINTVYTEAINSKYYTYNNDRLKYNELYPFRGKVEIPRKNDTVKVLVNIRFNYITSIGYGEQMDIKIERLRQNTSGDTNTTPVITDTELGAPNATGGTKYNYSTTFVDIIEGVQNIDYYGNQSEIPSISTETIHYDVLYRFIDFQSSSNYADISLGIVAETFRTDIVVL